MKTEHIITLLAVAFLLASCSSEGGGGDDDDNNSADDDDTTETIEQAEACAQLIECASAVEPLSVGALLETYGPGGSCWSDAETAAICEDSCEAALADFQLAFPNEPDCFENWTPPYTGYLDMMGSEGSASCSIDVAMGSGGGGEGTFTFEIANNIGWASECEVWLFDSGSGYCEGRDFQTGDLCDEGGVDRPGWAMDRVDQGWGAGGEYWDSWSLTLPYHGEIWPPEATASLFMCEQAPSGFEAYVCCRDYEVHDEQQCYGLSPSDW